MADQNRRGGEHVELDGGALGKLLFDWHEDRYQHRWEFGSQQFAALRSVDLGSDALWPASPPLQQIHQQSFGDGREVVFGVGMAGRGHWSASFTLVPDLSCWIVELACRSSVVAESLSATYQLAGQWEREQSGAVGTVVNEQRVALEAIEPAELSMQQAQALLRPKVLTKTPGTQQWAFRLRVN